MKHLEPSLDAILLWRIANSAPLTADSFSEQMRIIRGARVDLDLFLDVPASIPAGLYPELGKHGIRATYGVVARVIVLGPSILQLDDVVGCNVTVPKVLRAGMRNRTDRKSARYRIPTRTTTMMSMRFMCWTATRRRIVSLHAIAGSGVRPAAACRASGSGKISLPPQIYPCRGLSSLAVAHHNVTGHCDADKKWVDRVPTPAFSNCRLACTLRKTRCWAEGNPRVSQS